MRAFLLTFIGLSLIFVGCGRGEGGGDIPASANLAAEAVGRATTQYGGEWSRVPEKDRQIIVAHFGGDEALAERTIRNASLAPRPPAAGQAPSQYLPQ